MKSFVFVVLLIMFGIILFSLYHEATQKRKKGYIKKKCFLYMTNSGDDPCEKEQVINTHFHYCQPNSWLLGE